MNVELLTYKTCGSCSQEMPVSEFEKKPRSPDGLASVCKHCGKLKKKAVNEHVRRTAKEIDRVMLDAVGRLAREAPESDGDVPNIGETMECVVQAFGGPQGIALQMAATYLIAEPGSATRQRILADLLRNNAKATELGYGKTPVEMLTDEALDKFIEEKAHRTLKLKLIGTDATTPETIAG